jgi:hypothetical protein
MAVTQSAQTPFKSSQPVMADPRAVPSLTSIVLVGMIRSRPPLSYCSARLPFAACALGGEECRIRQPTGDYIRPSKA